MRKSALLDTVSITRARLYDVASILAFALLARTAHRSKLGLTFFGWLDTAWPFLTGLVLGWLVTKLAGLATTRVAPAGVITWLCAAVTGLSIWGVRHHAVPHWSFMVVAGSVSALLLLGWRALAARFSR